MKRLCYLITLILPLIILNTAYSSSIWKYSERTGWGDGNMPDGDKYGNTNIWKYLYTTKGASFNPSTYSNMPYFLQLPDFYNGGRGWHLSSNMQADERYCFVGHYWSDSTEVISPSFNYDAIIQFRVPYTGLFSVHLEILNSWSNDGVNIYLQKNSTVLSSSLLNGQKIVDTTLNLNSGDLILLRINSVNNGWADITTINDFTVSEIIPEPATLFLIGLSALTVCCRKRKN